MAIPPPRRPASPRVRFAIAATVVAAAIFGMVAFSLQSSTAYYLTPGELAAGPVDGSKSVRVAGRVAEGSISTEGPTTRFVVTDGEATVAVTTEDLLPDTFAAGVEVVAEGAMTDRGVFSAAKVLAKCPSKFTEKTAASSSG